MKQLTSKVHIRSRYNVLVQRAKVVFSQKSQQQDCWLVVSTFITFLCC